MKLLNQMISQYRTRHGTLPQQVVVTPAALAALAVKRAVMVQCQGVKVLCREIEPHEPTPSGPSLGVAVRAAQLVSFDLNG